MQRTFFLGEKGSKKLWHRQTPHRKAIMGTSYKLQRMGLSIDRDMPLWPQLIKIPQRQLKLNLEFEFELEVELLS